jgi:hypothetical protein
MSRYQLPESLGGATVDGRACSCFESGDPVVEIADGHGGYVHIRETVLTLVAPAEPPQGSIVLDSSGDAWHRKDDFWWFGSRMVTWAQLLKEHDGNVQLYGSAPEPVSGQPFRFGFELARELPATFIALAMPPAHVPRELQIAPGKSAGQFRIQVNEGTNYGRAAVLTHAEAEAAAWSILAHIYDVQGSES